MSAAAHWLCSAEIKRLNSSISNTHISCTETFLCIVQPVNDAPAVFSLHLCFNVHRFLH